MADVLAEVLRVLEELRAEMKRKGDAPCAPAAAEQLVTLDQIAGYLRLAKRSMERHRKRMPPPALQGQRGRKSRWRWSEVRPWLEKEYGCSLPERFPTW